MTRKAERPKQNFVQQDYNKKKKKKKLPTLSSVMGPTRGWWILIELCLCLPDSKNPGMVLLQGKSENIRLKSTEIYRQKLRSIVEQRRKISPTSEIHRSCKRNPDARSFTSPEPTDLLPLFT